MVSVFIAENWVSGSTNQKDQLVIEHLVSNNAACAANTCGSNDQSFIGNMIICIPSLNCWPGVPGDLFNFSTRNNRNFAIKLYQLHAANAVYFIHIHTCHFLIVATLIIRGLIKWPTMCTRHFEWVLLMMIVVFRSQEFVLKCLFDNKFGVGSDSGLVPNRRQAITWSYVDQDLRRHLDILLDVTCPLWRHQKAVSCLGWDKSISDTRPLSRTPGSTRQDSLTSALSLTRDSPYLERQSLYWNGLVFMHKINGWTIKSLKWIKVHFSINIYIYIYIWNKQGVVQ